MGEGEHVTPEQKAAPHTKCAQCNGPVYDPAKWLHSCTFGNQPALGEWKGK